MNGRYLLDTNIIIALFAGEPAIQDNLRKADEIFIPSVAVGELYFGAQKSERAEENLARVDELATSSVVLGCDLETARRYGEIKHTLKTKGRPMPENDVWIAAIAVQHDLTLITRDAHFSDVANLRIATW